jgi:hypothetical protein
MTGTFAGHRSNECRIIEIVTDGIGRQTRYHSAFEADSSSVFFSDRCVATERTVSFEPLLFRA